MLYFLFVIFSPPKEIVPLTQKDAGEKCSSSEGGDGEFLQLFIPIKHTGRVELTSDPLLTSPNTNVLMNMCLIPICINIFI